MKAGDTFYFPPNIDPGRHLWTIISDTDKNPEKVIAVCFSTHEDYKEQTCVVEKGEHERITHKSIVAYSNPETPSVWQLNKMESEKAIARAELLSPKLLKKIRSCVGHSNMPMGLILFLGEQGVL